MTVSWRFLTKGSMNHGGDCRTAPASPGLLIVHLIWQKWFARIWIKLKTSISFFLEIQLKTYIHKYKEVSWIYLNKTRHTMTYSVFLLSEFSPNRPTGPIRSCSRDVRPYLSCILSPSHAIFSKASHQPSDQMISSRPLIGHPFPSESPPPNIYIYIFCIYNFFWGGFRRLI